MGQEVKFQTVFKTKKKNTYIEEGNYGFVSEDFINDRSSPNIDDVHLQKTQTWQFGPAI